MEAKKIELTDLEKKMLDLNVSRDFNPMTATVEEAAAMNSVIHKAEDLMEELDAYEELGDSLMEWFKAKYEEQQDG